MVSVNKLTTYNFDLTVFGIIAIILLLVLSWLNVISEASVIGFLIGVMVFSLRLVKNERR